MGGKETVLESPRLKVQSEWPGPKVTVRMSKNPIPSHSAHFFIRFFLFFCSDYFHDSMPSRKASGGPGNEKCRSNKTLIYPFRFGDGRQRGVRRNGQNATKKNSRRMAGALKKKK